SVVRDARDVLAPRFTDWEIVLVDDGSVDDSVAVARAALGDDAHRLVAVRHETKRGYGATVMDGLSAARGRLLAFMDGDRQFDARDIGVIVDRLSETGDGMVAGIRADRADPWHRSVVSGVMNRLVRLLYGIRRRDVDCGLKVFRRELYVQASPLLAHSALFNTELFFKAQRLGYGVEQIPVRHLPRVAGRRSGGRLIPILRALRDLVLLRLRLATQWHPDAAQSAAHAWLLFLPAFAAFVITRLPSFWEPHWYTDEAGYVTTAQTLLHGHTLYSQIWTNKPPLTVLVVAALVHLFGPSEAALHLVTAASGLATIGAVYWAAWRLLGPRRAVVASLVAALALGLPVFDAELMLPESLLIAPVAWAGALIAVHLARPGSDASSGATGAQRGLALWPFVAGALVAVAIAFQQSALAETLAFTLALLISPVARLRDAAAFLGTVIALTAAWVIAVIAIAGAHTIGFALVGFYIQFTQSVLPQDHAGAFVHFGLAVLAGLLFVFGAIPLRTSARPIWFFVLWAGATLMVAGVSGQPYAHYLTPAVAPLALCIASMHRIPLRGITGARFHNALRSAPQIIGVVIAAVMASNAGLDWVSSPTPSSILNGKAINNSRNFGVYYVGAIQAVVGAQTRQDWGDGFDSRVHGDAAVASYIQREGLGSAPTVVWSSDAWVYALAQLPNMMPTPPIYNDEVLLGQNGPVASYVANLNPQVIVTSLDALVEFPEIQNLLNTKYVASFWYNPNTVWVRADLVDQLP
ncbi:MAG: glycosyltransferase, partial [Candidatus Dormibacteraeota bacterium]|nr:glycosyltransferase [Candidatus Dormibacteraeota bacterium]